MKTHLTVYNTNLTDYIVPDSYEVYEEDVYKSWEDGNMVEHRVQIAKKVKGKFKIRCSEDTLPLSQFLDKWNHTITNGYAQIGVYVINKDSFQAVQCYYAIRPAQHVKSIGGQLYDVLEVEITQR